MYSIHGFELVSARARTLHIQERFGLRGPSDKHKHKGLPSNRPQCNLLQLGCQYNFWTLDICPID